MATERVLKDAEAFAAGYQPAAGDHPDLESRVVMYRRAVEGGDRRVVAVHARTLTRFVGHLGIGTPTGGDDGPSKADLQARAEELDLPKSGSKAQLASRIAERERELEEDEG